MSEMNNVENRTFADLFSGEVQYAVPLFQRDYVWGQREWSGLYTDIVEAMPDLLQTDMERMLEFEHFFGPIVVRKRPKQLIPNMQVFDIIDGQQRITTVYLMLAYFRRRLKASTHPKAREWCAEISKFMENPNPRPGHDYDRLKIFSFKRDRLATWYAVRCGFLTRDITSNTPKTPGYAEDERFYDLNRKGKIPYAFERWMNLHFGRAETSSIWLWAQILTQCLQVVWIPLREKDNPQAIFESLNAKNIPLSATDLLVNYIFRRIIEEGEGDADRLHSEWFSARHDIKMWLGKSDAFEEYLRHLFSIGQKKMVGARRKLYEFFKRNFPEVNTNADAARDKLKEIIDSTRLYGCIVGRERFYPKNPAIDSVLADIRDTRMDSCRPFLLAVIQAVEDKNNDMSAEDALMLFREVRTLLVRCKIVDRRTTQYDTLFPPLLNNIQDKPGMDMVAAMHKEIRNAQFWVSDEEFIDGFVTRALYRRPGDLGFTHLILREVDKYLTLTKGSGVVSPDYDALGAVEHIAPQTPTEGWLKETSCKDEEAYKEVPIHTIGNLCLRNWQEKSGMGQSPFADKQKKLANLQSVLARKIAGHEGLWNKAAIEQRSHDLAEHAVKIWGWSTTRD